MKTNERNLTIDFIKAFSIFGVIAIHVNSVLLTNTNISSFSWNVGLFYGVLFRQSVPLFLMASGAIMLNPDKELPLKRLYFHNILRIVVAMIFWGICYKMYHLIQSHQFTTPILWHSFKEVLLFNQEFHFYYIHVILVTYIFLPVTRLLAKNADKKLYIYALILLFFFGTVYPTLRVFHPFRLLSGYTKQWTINFAYASIGYSLLGYYLKTYPLSIKKSLCYTVTGLFSTILFTVILSHHDNTLNEVFLQGLSPTVFLSAIGMFGLSSHFNVKGFLKKIITYVSKASFFIYLSHLLILYAFQNYGITAQMISPVISVPLITLMILGICILIYSIISKIPLLNQYIM